MTTSRDLRNKIVILVGAVALALPLTAVVQAPSVAAPAPATTQAVSQGPLVATPPPIDRFENRRPIGQEGLVVVGHRGQLDAQVGRIPKVDIRRVSLQTEFVDGDVKLVNPRS